MQELFSCRNCIHNCGQSLNVGNGKGYCLKHSTVIHNTDRTTCKYQHRKDLAFFIVSEARGEHASEFSHFSGLADLYRNVSLNTAHYSERYAWENKDFDSLTNAIARYHQSGKKWVFIEAMTGGVDGRRSIAQSSFTRRYMDQCGTWRSSFRLTIDVVSQLSIEPKFDSRDLYAEGGGVDEALWDVLFSKIVLVQEYGWHAGIERLQWFTDWFAELGEFNWVALQPKLVEATPEVLEIIFRHARENDAYFKSPGSQEFYSAEGEVEEYP